jgi:hypothetical protein
MAIINGLIVVVFLILVAASAAVVCWHYSIWPPAGTEHRQ